MSEADLLTAALQPENGFTSAFKILVASGSDIRQENRCNNSTTFPPQAFSMPTRCFGIRILLCKIVKWILFLREQNFQSNAFSVSHYLGGVNRLT